MILKKDAEIASLKSHIENIKKQNEEIMCQKDNQIDEISQKAAKTHSDFIS